MKTARSKRSSAFTLVELLVVITIIALLISLLLPAVQSAREAARQAQCQNNMKQLGLACLNYENQYWCFPPSSYFPDGTDPGASRTHQRNWVISILPFLEQQSVYDSFDLSTPINNPGNRAARGTDLAVMQCPSDLGHKVKFASVNATEGDYWARGNYAANASLGYNSPAYGNLDSSGTNHMLSSSRWHRAIMGSNLSMGVSEIYDGASNTILLGEIRIGLGPRDRRGTWALEGAGSSSLWGHAWGDDNGPNPCCDNSDDILDCGLATTSAGGGQVAEATCMTCYNGVSGQAAPRSRHAGGVYVTMADGSARFISNYVEKGSGIWWNNTTGSIILPQFLCWQRLCASQDGQVIDGKKF